MRASTPLTCSFADTLSIEESLEFGKFLIEL